MRSENVKLGWLVIFVVFLSKHLASLPLERREGVEKYSNCKMFNRNYSALSRLWLDKNPNEILINHKHLLEENKSYEIINCQHGWHYDQTMFPATVVSEVNYEINFECDAWNLYMKLI